jgi:hypothetical protein
MILMILWHLFAYITPPTFVTILQFLLQPPIQCSRVFCAHKNRIQFSRVICALKNNTYNLAESFMHTKPYNFIELKPRKNLCTNWQCVPHKRVYISQSVLHTKENMIQFCRVFCTEKSIWLVQKSEYLW